MPDSSSITTSTIQIMNAVQDTSFSTILVTTALILIVFTGYYSYLLINKDPKEVELWQKLLLLASFSFCIGCFVSSRYYVTSERVNAIIMTKEKAICNLGENTRIDWLIRLISYDPKSNSALSISQLVNLGSPKFKYVFVGSYDELKNRSASDAIQKLGGSVGPVDHVSAIIYRVQHVFPANARGVLQVIRKIENQNGDASFKRLIRNDTLSDDELSNLENDRDISGWAWTKYAKYYGKFCKNVQRFRCDKSFAAHELMSAFDSDYHPLGFAQVTKEDGCEDTEFPVCKRSGDWNDIAGKIKSNFGARVFLTENSEIKDLGSRYLIEFDRPDQQIIPDIGFIRDPIKCSSGSS